MCCTLNYRPEKGACGMNFCMRTMLGKLDLLNQDDTLKTLSTSGQSGVAGCERKTERHVCARICGSAITFEVIVFTRWCLWNSVNWFAVEPGRTSASNCRHSFFCSSAPQ